jgi:hypothetical protein
MAFQYLVGLIFLCVSSSDGSESCSGELVSPFQDHLAIVNIGVPSGDCPNIDEESLDSEAISASDSVIPLPSVQRTVSEGAILPHVDFGGTPQIHDLIGV